MPQDLRTFLEQYGARVPGAVRHVSEPVDRLYDIQAIIELLERHGECPVLVFDDVRGADLPVVANVLASRDTLAQALDVQVDELRDTYARRLDHYVEPVVHPRSSWRGTVYEGDDADLGMLPIPTCFPGDAGPYITSGLTVAGDPAGNGMTMGFHRYQVKGPRDLGVSLHSRRRMFEFHRRAEENGADLPVALCIGLHPAFALGALSYPPAGASKLDVVGGLLGEPVEVMPCVSIDLNVPAWADIVVEGEILAGVREPEGPFGEFTGYFSQRSTQNVFRVSAITIREGAWYQTIAGGRAADHVSSLGLAREAAVANAVRRVVPNVTAVSVPNSGCSSFLAFVAIHQTRAGEARHAITATLGTDHYLKGVVIVDDDVDVTDERDMMWAIATRCQYDRDVLVVPDSLGTILDPSASDDGVTDKIGIDATRPFGREFAERLAVAPESEELARKVVDRLLRSGS